MFKIGKIMVILPIFYAKIKKCLQSKRQTCIIKKYQIIRICVKLHLKFIHTTQNLVAFHYDFCEIVCKAEKINITL